MDIGLFEKYNKTLKKIQDSKQDIIQTIQEKTSIIITEEEIVLSKKTITLVVSSVKRSVLLKSDVKSLLLEKGYIVKL